MLYPNDKVKVVAAFKNELFQEGRVYEVEYIKLSGYVKIKTVSGIYPPDWFVFIDEYDSNKTNKPDWF